MTKRTSVPLWPALAQVFFFWFFWAGGFGGTLQNEKEKFARGLLHLTVRVILCNVQAE